MKRLCVVSTLGILAVLLFFAVCSIPAASDALLFEASLKNGDYGAGSAVNTMPPDHGGSPGVLGIEDSPYGVTYTSTETDDRSNALINWYIADSADRLQFRNAGTVSFMFKADRETHVSGAIFGDNYGFGEFHNGQSTISASASRVTNGEGTEDDQVQIRWSTTDGTGPWYWRDPVILEYDQWYHLGLAWGGSVNSHETWVCGELGAYDSEGPIPWGVSWGTGSATNVGLGDNHERGYDAYGSAAGVTFADIRIWTEYQPQGDTKPCDEPILGLSAINNSPTVLGQSTIFTATVISGTNVAYNWGFGDGEFGEGAVTSHQYEAIGTYTATVTATNSISEMTAATTVSIEAQCCYIYLPLVVRE
ncbi:MAG: PKD domain-containing protein [Anaerolineales bacterium]|jgi:hypothetical protein